MQAARDQLLVRKRSDIHDEVLDPRESEVEASLLQRTQRAVSQVSKIAWVPQEPGMAADQTNIRGSRLESRLERQQPTGIDLIERPSEPLEKPRDESSVGVIAHERGDGDDGDVRVSRAIYPARIDRRGAHDEPCLHVLEQRCDAPGLRRILGDGEIDDEQLIEAIVVADGTCSQGTRCMTCVRFSHSEVIRPPCRGAIT